jgi:hypothetical protein
MSNSDDLDIVRREEAILQKEEDLKAWCPSSGENVGRMIEIQGSDEWYITCPTCGTRRAGGSTVLPDHQSPGLRWPARRGPTRLRDQRNPPQFSQLQPARSERISPGSRTWTASRATSSIARHNSMSPSQPRHGRRTDLDEKHPGAVPNHMQQGRLRTHSLTPATAGKEGTNVTNEVGLCCATKMSTDRPKPA